MGKWKCKNCGNKNDGKAKFCSSCGTPFQTENQTAVVNPAVETMESSSAANSVETSALTSNATENSAADIMNVSDIIVGDSAVAKPKSKKKKVILISAIGGTVILVLVGLYLFFFSGLFGRGKEKNNLFNDDRLRFKEDGKYGYIDTSGKIAIDAKYKNAGSFSEGLAPVKEDEKWGYIDKNGDVKIDYKYDSADEFNKYGYAVVTEDKKKGIINKDGEFIIAADYDRVYQVDKDRFVAGNKKDDDSYTTTYSLYDEKGNRISDIEFFSGGYRYEQGLLSVQNRSEKYGYIDKSGTYVIDAKFDKAYDFSEDLAAVGFENSNSSKNDEDNKKDSKKTKTYRYGYINKKGETVISDVYEDAEAFSEGLAAVKKDGKWGYINKKGEMVIKPEYDTVSEFLNGYAVVGNNSKDDSKIYGVIDKNGKQMIGIDYDDIGYGNEMFMCEKDGECRFLDESGKYAIDERFHKSTIMFDDGYAVVATDNKKFVVIDKNGKQITDDEFDGLQLFDKDNFCKEEDCYNSSYYGSSEGYCEKHFKELEDPHNLLSSMWTHDFSNGGLYLFFHSKGEGKMKISRYDNDEDDKEYRLEWKTSGNKVIIINKDGVNGDVYLTMTFTDENTATILVDGGSKEDELKVTRFIDKD